MDDLPPLPPAPAADAASIAAPPGWLSRAYGLFLLAVVVTVQVLRLLKADLRLLAFLLLAAPLAYAGAHIFPVYLRHYLLVDQVTDIAHTATTDEHAVRYRLAWAVHESGLDLYVSADAFQIQTDERFRRIVCNYAVPVQLLPHVSRRLPLRIEVEEPLLFNHNVVFY